MTKLTNNPSMPTLADAKPYLRAAAVGTVATGMTAVALSKGFLPDGNSLKFPGPWIAGAVVVGLPLAMIDAGNHVGAANPAWQAGLVAAAPMAGLGGWVGLAIGRLRFGDAGGMKTAGYTAAGALLAGALGGALGVGENAIDRRT